MQRSWFLYLTTFICGMAVMAVELSASRLLAPFYGSSMITWTILIGVIMVALSLGNLRAAGWPIARARKEPCSG